MSQSFIRSKVACAVALAFVAPMVSFGVLAADNPVETVLVTNDREVGDISPTKTSLLAIEPQSLISRTFIEENMAAGANYSDIVNFSPSVMSVDPNGPGLMESQSLTIRGFQDGQYNVTFDGIPWGDSNDFTHHSTVYFMPQDMGGIAVDRGPGDASNKGNATFGGTIAISSKQLTSQASSSVFGSYGSWNTSLLGVQHETGGEKKGEDWRSYFSFKDLHSDGFLTNSGQDRQNFFAKAEKSLTADTEVTAVMMLNHTAQHTPYGSTLAQQQQYGYNLGLVNNVQSEDNSAWNKDELQTDFGYIGVKTKQAGWMIDNKAYTYAYTHAGYYGWNAGSVSLADTQNDGGTSNGANNVPGGKMHNNYRSIGDIFNATREIGPGDLILGIWYDHQNDYRFEQQVDWTTGGTPNNAGGTVVDGAYGQGVDRDMHNKLITFQAYAKYDWKITDALLLDFGGRYASFTRDLNATVNQKTLTPFDASHTWGKFLPAATARYALSPNASVYAQYAQGFLAPNLNVFYKTAPNLNSVHPTASTNYQAGVNWSNSVLNGGAAIYRITTTNLASGVACPAGVTGACYNVTPGATFSGLELEGSTKVGHGLSLYGNYAVNNYTTSDASVLQNTPKNNAALGIFYHQGNWTASLLDKFVSSRFSNTDASGNNIRLSGYSLANANLDYKFDGGLMPKNAKVSFKINNLFNKQGDLASINSDSSGDPLYFVIPTRSYQVGFSLPF